MKSTGWTAPTEPSRISICKLYFPSADVAFRYKASGHLFIRKSYNAPNPPGKSWSTIDRALQNGSQLFGAKHIVKANTVSSKRAENSFII